MHDTSGSRLFFHWNRVGVFHGIFNRSCLVLSFMSHQVVFALHKPLCVLHFQWREGTSLVNHSKISSRLPPLFVKSKAPTKIQEESTKHDDVLVLPDKTQIQANVSKYFWNSQLKEWVLDPRRAAAAGLLQQNPYSSASPLHANKADDILTGAFSCFSDYSYSPLAKMFLKCPALHTAAPPEHCEVRTHNWRCLLDKLGGGPRSDPQGCSAFGGVSLNTCAT